MNRSYGIRCASGLVVALTISVAASDPAHAQADLPPNILLVIADDMGLDVSPCYSLGADKPDMAVLETMCREGVVFDNAWAEPTCSPTRAAILTGRYGFRTGVLSQIGGPNAVGGIRPDEMSIQRLLDEQAPAIYAHAVVGKWHLSDSTNGGAENPEVMGVGFYSGLIGGALRDYYQIPLTTDGVTEQIEGYATTVFTDIAIDWLSRQEQPWFLWLAYTAPHTPFHLPPAGLHQRELVDDPAAIEADPLPYYLAALEALDHEMGRLLDSLPQAQRDNTIVIFIGDNGTPRQVVQAPYTPRTAKGTLYPGGIMVPMVVSGAGVSRKGEREAAFVTAVDLFATIADLAGAGQDRPIDGVSFRPLLAAAGAGGRDVLYAEYESSDARMSRNNGWTIRDGVYQLLMLDSGARALFDVASDPGGNVNLLADGSADVEAIASGLQDRAEALWASR